MSAASLLADEQVRAVIRYRCETDFLFFSRFFFKCIYQKKFDLYDYHHQITDELMECARGENNRLIINIAPRIGKTQFCSIFFMAWGIACNPRAKFIHLSYSDELALENSAKVKDIILTEEFQLLWPHIKLRDDAKAKKKWYTEQGGGIYATSSGGAVTGFGAGERTSAEDSGDRSHIQELEELGLVLDWFDSEQHDDNLFSGAIIIDDPIKPEDAASPVIRKSINGRMNSTIVSRVNSPKTPIIVIMQRVHEEDTTGFLLDPNAGTGDVWKHLMLPALIENEDGTYSSICPNVHSVESLLKKRKADPNFSGQYQQTPTPATGGVVSLNWFERYRIEPVEFDQIVISCDTAYKPGQENDPSVAMVFGKFRRRWYVLRIWRERVTYPNLKRTVAALCDLYSPHALLVEDKASGQSLIQDFREEGRPVIAIQPEGDKKTRMLTQAPLLEAGLVLLPESSDWMSEFQNEIVNFPVGKHDDQVDALSQFLKWSRKAITFEQDIVIELPESADYYDDDDY